MFKIDWHQLEKNAEKSPQYFFEKFNYHIAVIKFSSYGKFDHYYNTPGSEFYLTLTRDCDELSAKAGDVIGWQAKWWLNRSDSDNSPLDSKNRNELLDGFKTSLKYKPALKTWIICTPGRFINTAPAYPVNKLEDSLKRIKPAVNIFYWYKEYYEAIFHSAPEQYASIFNDYFSAQFLGFQLFAEHSGKRLYFLRKRYNTDLYTPGKQDREILSSIFYKNLGPSDFFANEFGGKYSIPALNQALKNDGLTINKDTIEALNDLLKQPDLYEQIIQRRSNKVPSKSLNDLKQTYDESKAENDLKRLNRSVLEEFFPEETPKRKDLFGKLSDEIKHAIEYGTKLSRSRLYREDIDKFMASPGSDKGDENTKEEIGKIKALMDELLTLFENLRIYETQEITLQFTKQLFSIIETRREKINTLLQETGVPDMPDYEIDIGYEPDIKDVYNFRNYLYSLAGSLIDKTKKVYRRLVHISRQSFNIFGEAGFGKTNIACAITERLLSRDLPVLLIPASEIRGNGVSIEKQILGLLGIDASISLKDFIGMLHSKGFRHGIKIPIIIDGLNETQPSAKDWHQQLQYIIRDIETFDNVMLITTCRNAYVKQIFDEDNVDDVPYSSKLEGFREDNLEEAIEKYFKKYDITPRNRNFDKNLLRNPLFLQIFSETNEGNKAAEINEANIYAAIESYVTKIIEKVATKDRQLDPILKTKTVEGLARYSAYLWNNNSRQILYEDGIGLLQIFDPNYKADDWTKTISYRILDEGLLFRNMQSGVEYAEFNYSLIGGFCIAKTVIFDGKKPEEIISTLKSDDLIRKLTSEDAASRHPFSEDILKSIVFLCPRYTGKELFEVVDHAEIIRASFSVLRIIVSREEGWNSFIRYFTPISSDSPTLPRLLESVLLEILRNEDYRLVELLKIILLKMKPNQIDLNWSEIIRRYADEIIPYLFRQIELFQIDQEHGGNVIQQLVLVSLLLSSTNRYLRDKATKTLVMIGRKYPALLFDVFLSLEEIADLYIAERMIAAICGVFLAIDNKELLFRVCKHLEKNCIENIKTTHVLILDYIITLLDYAEINFNYARSLRRPATDGLIEWQRDPECISKVTDATWGFGPVGYDFAKYKIGTYLAQYGYEKDSKLPTLKEALAMVVWRTKELGYTKELFEEVDKALSNQEHKKYGYNSSYASTMYRKKYRDIAFYELYGHNIIRGLSQDFKDEDGFRVSPAYIDPTFPSIATKRQLITCCFLPKRPDDVQAWIDNNDSAFMETHYIRTDIEKDDAEWVMLYGHLVQEGIEKSRIDISLYTIVVPEDRADGLMDKIRRNELFMPYLVAENHNVYAGEIPWSKNYLDGIRHEEIDGDEVELYLPVSSYYQQTKSEIEGVGHVYVPSKKLAQTLGLRINLNDFNLYTTSGEKASSYIHDNHSSFVYFRRDLLKQYLHDSRQSMIWIEIASKYGAFGEHKKKYDPSFKDCRFVKRFVIKNIKNN